VDSGGPVQAHVHVMHRALPVTRDMRQIVGIECRTT
jgi:hypothetical protein